jgi:TP901 family phage tail tape measure protein
LTFLLKAATDSSYNAAFNNAKSKLNEYQQVIKQNNSILNDISAYQKQQSAVEKTTQIVEEKKKAYDKAAAAAKAAGSEDEALNEKEAKTKNALEAANQKLKDQTSKLDEIKSRLETAGVDVNNLSESEKKLADATEKTKQKQEELASSQNALIDQIAEMETLAASAYTAIQAVEKLGEAWQSCISAAEGFEYSLSGVQAVSGATNEELSEMGAVAKEVGATTIYTATEISDAMEYMGLAGWNAQEIISGIPAVANLAAAAGEDLSRVSDIVTDSMQALGYSADDTTHFCDVLANTVTNANTTVDLMGDTLKYVSSTAGALGYSIEDVSTAIAAMANNGIKGSMNGTALRNILASLAAPSTDAAEALDELGVSLSDETGNVVGLNEVFSELRSSMNGLSEIDKVAYASTIAGKRGMSGLLAIVNTTEEEYNELYQTISDCDGAAESMAETRLDNFQGSVIILESAFDALKTSIGEISLDFLQQGAEDLTDVTNAANEFVKKYPQVVTGAEVATAAFGAFAVGLTGVATAIKLVDTLFLGTAFANPGLWASAAIVAGIVGISTALATMWANTETATEKMSALLDDYAALEDNEALIDIYREQAEAVQDATLSAEELEYEQGQLDEAVAALKEAYPELLGNIEAGTEEWDLQTEAIYRNIEAQKLADGEEISTNMQGVMDTYVAAEAQVNSSTAAYEAAMENWEYASAHSTDEVLEHVKELRNDLQEKVELGEIDVDSDTYKTKIGEISQWLGSLVGEGVSVESLGEANYMIERLDEGYYELSDGASYWSTAARDASDTNVEALGDAQEAMDQFKEAMDAGTITFDELKELSGDYNITLGELGYTASTIGGQIANGELTVAEAMERYGISMATAYEDVAVYRRELENAASAQTDLAEAAEVTNDTLIGSYDDFSNVVSAIAAVNSETLTANQAAKLYGISVDDLNDYLTIAEERQENVAGACKTVEAGYMDAKEAADVFGVTTAEMDMYQAEQSLESLEKELEDLQDDYEQAYESALTSIQGQSSLQEGLSLDADRTVLTVDNAISNMQQIESYWATYQTNLEALQGYGLSTDFLTRYCDETSDGVANTQDLATELGNMNTEDRATKIAELNSAFSDMAGQEDTTAQHTADLETSFTEMSSAIETKIQELQNQVKTDMGNMVAELNQSGAAGTAGAATGLAYYNALQSKLSLAVTSAKTTAVQVAAALSTSGSGSSTKTGTGYAHGGFTNGPSVAGEDPNYPTEAVISFDPAYREENIGYLKAAAEMLGMGSTNQPIEYMENGTEYQYGGLTEYGAQMLASLSNQKAAEKAVYVGSGADSTKQVVVQYSPNVQVSASNGESIAEQLNAYSEELEERVTKVIRDMDKKDRRTSYGY